MLAADPPVGIEEKKHGRDGFGFLRYMLGGFRDDVTLLIFQLVIPPLKALYFRRVGVSQFVGLVLKLLPAGGDLGEFSARLLVELAFGNLHRVQPV